MINQHVVELINTRNTWAFVGSGVSVDAGLPSWKELYSLAVKGLTGHTPESVEILDLAVLFENLIQDHGREAVHTQVKTQLNNITIPGDLHKLVALWPFRNYVTTNYDPLLDAVLRDYAGWISVGNSAPETRRISKDVSNTIWHPHGMIGLPDHDSRLIISQNDYDEYYAISSLVKEALQSVLRMHHFVFIGFGFNDPDLLQLLRIVSRVSDPSKPAYAFLSGMTESRIRQFRIEYNIVTIPYVKQDGDHSDLLSLLRHYNSFIVRRNIEIGTCHTSEPSYDPQVTSLIVQNALYDKSINTTQEIHEQVMRATLVAVLSDKGSMSKTDLEMYVRINNTEWQHAAFSSSLSGLIEKGIIVKTEDIVDLTSSAHELANKRQSAAQLRFDQFLSSLKHRARHTQNELSSDSSNRVSEVAADFFQSVCRDRGLAIAQNLAGGPEHHVKYRTIAIIQDLPNWFTQCQTSAESNTLVKVVVRVLSEPRQEEKVYLGLLTQAYFGKHIAGFDKESIAIRQRLLSETTFVLDSHFIIVLLAKGCVGHKHAVETHRLLSASKAPMVATNHILVETVEHLKYAMNKIGMSRPTVSSEQLFEDAQAGQTNAFMTGYYESLSQGEKIRFSSYVMDTLNAKGTDILPVDMIRYAVQKLGICVESPQEWPSYDESLWQESHELVEQIKTSREERGSYKHPRQVTAEAEVARVVCSIREGKLHPPGTTSSYAFFLTDSRILDSLKGQPQHLCIKPSSLHQWLLSTMPFTDAMASNVFENMLLELIETGIQFVPREQIIRAFGTTIQAGRDTIQKVVSEHKSIIEEMYVTTSSADLFNIDDLLVPSTADNLKMAVLLETKRRLAVAQEKQRHAEKKNRELEELKDYAALRDRKRKKAQQRKRSAQSKPKTKRKKQKDQRRKKGKTSP